MTLRQQIEHLLTRIGPGRHISPSAYDTAWVARLSAIDEPLGQAALEWLRANQLADGSWGAASPCYYHDRLVCTLAAVNALAKFGQPGDERRWRRARFALETMVHGLPADPAGETVGFEMLVPMLASEAVELGIFGAQDASPVIGLAERLSVYRKAKLQRLPTGRIDRNVTVAFSSEMVGLDGLDLLDVAHLQEENGSVACSPAATSFFALNVCPGNEKAMAYLRRFATDGGVPYVAPIDVFEIAWPLWNLALTDVLDDELLNLCQRHLDYLERAWTPGAGVGGVTEMTVKDGDDTALTFEALGRFGRAVDLEGVLNFEVNGHFRCYGLEANPSLSTNIHVLSALRQAGLDRTHPTVSKVLDFLSQVRTLRTFWFDKWHASPYYSTAHAIIACAGYCEELVADAVYWIQVTQNKDGSWGYYMPTAEETAYCLQALVVWERYGHEVAANALRLGAAWLAEHGRMPYPPLWIGKCLYSADLVIESAVLSALALVAER